MLGFPVVGLFDVVSLVMFFSDRKGAKKCKKKDCLLSVCGNNL